MRGIGADMQVVGEGLALVEMHLHAVPQRLKGTGGDGLVDVAPLHLGFGGFVADDEAILRRAPGATTGLHRQRTGGGKLPLTPIHGNLGQRSGRELVVSGCVAGVFVTQRHEPSGSPGR